MGRLAGFRYHEVARKLRILGFEFDRPGAGSHELWRHVIDHHRVTLPHHARDIPEGTMRNIVREAGVTVQDFLDA